MAGKHDDLITADPDNEGGYQLYVDLLIADGEDPAEVVRKELMGEKSHATYVGGEWRQGYWEAHFRGSRQSLAMIQARSEGARIGNRTNHGPNNKKDHIVVCVKINTVDTHETKVETFGPFSHEDADAYALKLADELPAEWMFSSQQAQGNDITPEVAAQFLLNC